MGSHPADPPFPSGQHVKQTAHSHTQLEGSSQYENANTRWKFHPVVAGYAVVTPIQLAVLSEFSGASDGGVLTFGAPSCYCVGLCGRQSLIAGAGESGDSRAGYRQPVDVVCMPD